MNSAVKHAFREKNQIAKLRMQQGTDLFQERQFFVVSPLHVNESVWTDILETYFERQTKRFNLC